MTTPDPDTRTLLTALRRRFLDVDYTVDAVLDRIGESGQDGLGRNQTTPATRALGEATDPLATLIRLFLLQRSVDIEPLQHALPELLTPLLDAEIVELVEHGVRALIDIRPYATEDALPKWIVSDLTPGLDSPPPPMRPDYVLGVSPASTTLAQLTIRRPVGRALDLGAGCGVQSVHLADHAEQVVATDLNQRALRLAAWTAELNQTPVELLAGDLYAPVAEQSFDLIVSNPPYVMSPPATGAERLTYREGARRGDELVREVVTGGIERLTEGGTLQVLGNWAITDEDWGARIRTWFPETGVQALVLEREHLDVFSYIEIWLTDAGLVGTPDYLEQYDRWLDYFDELGIRGVGMGWITVRKSGDAPSIIRTESWPHAVAQPVGDALGDWLDAVGDSTMAAEQLWATNWRLDRRVDAETIGRPGAEDPEHVVYRQRTGLLRAVEVDTALGGVLGACDGDLPLGVIVDAVGQLLEVDPAGLRTDLLPRLRELIADGFLRRPRR
ncbi:DUF7059 domain-containing protein [Naumannella halotolerans]|uniref:DUF7059 domain-containing protein n=1 Tax=Naumannella halotolerans TaxID=993414 RepID=UPI001FB8E341|nr:methyltransferase [Naumannella halotolerans]